MDTCLHFILKYMCHTIYFCTCLHPPWNWLFSIWIVRLTGSSLLFDLQCWHWIQSSLCYSNIGLKMRPCIFRLFCMLTTVHFCNDNPGESSKTQVQSVISLFLSLSVSVCLSVCLSVSQDRNFNEYVPEKCIFPPDPVGLWLFLILYGVPKTSFVSWKIMCS